MFLLKSEYRVEDNKPAVYLFCREGGKRKVIIDDTLAPYFYIDSKEIGVLQGIRTDPETYEAIDGTMLKKVYVTLPEDVPKIRESYSKTWEADILFGNRYVIDRVDSIEATTPKIHFLDIEVDSVGRIPDVSLAQEPIICICVYDNLTDIYSTFVYREDLSPGTITQIFDDKLHEIHYFTLEEDMLKSFIEFISKEEPDIISGWNSNRFDLPYLLNRLKVLRIDANSLSPMNSAYIRDGKDVVIKGVALVDLYDAYRYFNQGMEESYTLDFIAKKVVNKGKLDTANNVRWMWKNKLDDLIKYNCNDTFLLYAINEKLKLLEFLDELRRISFCQLEDTMSASRLSDSYILRLFHNRKVFPTKAHHEKVTYEGAFVANWATGIYENVIVFDLRSLYPNIIRALNLSPETIITEDEAHWGDNICVNNTYIRKDKRGFLPEVIERLFEERAKYKELMNRETVETDAWKLYYNRQYALKTLLNALYGQTAYVGSRFYNPKVAETTTYVGRKIINWSKDFLETIGYSTLYIDTDALYFSIGKEIDMEQIDLVLELLNNSYGDFAKQFGVNGSSFSMEFEKVYRRAFFGSAKKRYAGACVWKLGQVTDVLEVIGFETRRSDASQFTRNLQKTVFDMLLRQDKSKETVLRYIGDEIDRIRTGKCPFTEIGIPKGINKDLSEYGKMVIVNDKYGGERKGIPANVRGAIYAQENLGHELSSKPKMIYISAMPNHLPKTDVLCFDEDSQVPPGTQIDIEKMLDKLVKKKLESIFEALGWKMTALVPWWKGKIAKEGTQLGLGLFTN